MLTERGGRTVFPAEAGSPRQAGQGAALGAAEGGGQLAVEREQARQCEGERSLSKRDGSSGG